jgi:natural product biosynthesis luciferase-like monooxygenase protein
MSDKSRLSCLLIGGTSFLTQCAEILLKNNHKITAVVSDDHSVISWCEKESIKCLSSLADLKNVSLDHFDYLLSLVNFKILPPEILKLPSKLAINYHDGPLPKYGGLNAPSWAIMQGEKEYGVTWHVMSDMADTGDIIKQVNFNISDDDSSFTLNAKCYEAGINSFSGLIQDLSLNNYTRRQHVLDKSTYCPRNRRPDNASIIDFRKPADSIKRMFLALDFGNQINPLGTPKLDLGTNTYIIKGLDILPSNSDNEPGTILEIKGEEIQISTASNDIVISGLMSLDGTHCIAEDEANKSDLSIGDCLPIIEKDKHAILTSTDERFSKHEKWWNSRLQGLELLSLPYANHHGSAAESPRDLKEKIFPFSAVQEGLKESSKSRGDTLFCALIVYFARLSGKPRFDIGFSSQNNDLISNPLTELSYGYVPLRVDIDLSMSFQDIKSDLVHATNSTAGKGTFCKDIFLRYPTISKSRNELQGLLNHVVIDRTADNSQTTSPPPSDLTIRIDDSGNQCLWIYDRQIFSDKNVDKMFKQLDVLIEGLMKKTQDKAALLPLVTPDEKKKIFFNWNSTKTDVQDDKCIHHLFEEQVVRTPEKIALSYKTEQLTYSELNKKANQLAHFLQDKGVGKESLIGLLLDRSANMVIALLGILKAGGAYVPLDPQYPANRLNFMADDSNIKLIITQNKYDQVLSDQHEMVFLNSEVDRLSTYSDENPVSDVNQENLAYLIYTSGSTGKPKGVMIEHRNVINFFAGMDQRIEHNDPGVWLSVTSISFDISVLELFWTLSHGFNVVIYSDESRNSSNLATSTRYPDKNIDLSLFYWNLAREDDSVSNKYRLLLESAKFGDENGFVAVWTPERHFHSFGGLFPNPSVISAALAVTTKNIQIRAGSCVLPLHSPIRVAEEWSVVDNLSNGRTGLGVAAGWNPNDFVIKPENHADAKNIMAESIDVLRKLWRGETLTFQGPHKEVDVRTLPRPIQKEVPIWMTIASNPETFILAAQNRTGVLTHLLGQSVEQVGKNLELYRKTWEECGHPGQGHIVVMLHTFVGESDEAVRNIVREPMKGYLANAANLVKAAAWHFPTFKDKSGQSGKDLDEYFDNISEEDMDDLLEFSFQRYFSTSGLLGSEEHCIEMIDKLKEIGVDEIGCLIDFGIETDIVLAHLENLAKLRISANDEASNTVNEDNSVATLIERHGVTHLQCTPTMLRILLSDEKIKRALSSLDNILVGGEQLTNNLVIDLKSDFTGNLTNMYGPTETTIWSSTFDVNNAESKISIGKPIANTQFYILDNNLQLIPVGVIGELYIGGNGVARGYLNRPELTMERFVTYPDTQARLYRTGDLARYLPDGNIEFIGRVDHQIKIRGYRIELGEIEFMLEKHPEIQSAIVSLHQDKAGDMKILAYFVPDQDKTPTAKEVRDFLKDQLPEHMIPSMFLLLNSIPLTPNGKINRQALPAPDQSSFKINSHHIAPRTDTEKTLAEQWESLLDIKPISVTDNFFDLGGDSLLAIEVLCHIMEAFNLQLPLHTVFQTPSIEKLARVIEANQNSDPSNQFTEIFQR